MHLQSEPNTLKSHHMPPPQPLQISAPDHDLTSLKCHKPGHSPGGWTECPTWTLLNRLYFKRNGTEDNVFKFGLLWFFLKEEEHWVCNLSSHHLLPSCNPDFNPVNYIQHYAQDNEFSLRAKQICAVRKPNSPKGWERGLQLLRLVWG